MTTKIAFVYADKDNADIVSKYVGSKLGVKSVSRVKSALGIGKKNEKYDFLKQQYDSVNGSAEKIIEDICQNKPDIIVVDPFPMAIKYDETCDSSWKLCGREPSPDDYNLERYTHFLDCLAKIETPTLIATITSHDFLLKPIEERELPCVNIFDEIDELGNKIKEYTPAEES